MSSKHTEKYLKAVVNKTVYQRKATDQDFPNSANCVTAIRALLKANGIFLPHGWVGDLPATLAHKEWLVLTRDSDSMKLGDLIFTVRKERITHIAMSLGDRNVFHCTSRKGAVIETWEEFSSRNKPFLGSALKLIEMRDFRSQT